MIDPAGQDPLSSLEAGPIHEDPGIAVAASLGSHPQLQELAATPVGLPRTDQKSKNGWGWPVSAYALSRRMICAHAGVTIGITGLSGAYPP